jgi:hypothetical protein
MRNAKLFFTCAALFVLTACGGGGGTGALTPASSTTIAGAVIDGYIEGAIVCLDLNANGNCESSEPSATSKADGSYSISYTGDTSGLHIVSVIPATAKDKDDNGLTLAQAGKAAFTLMAPAPQANSADTHITPLTTLVSNQMVQTGTKDAASVETQLKQQLGISSSLLNNDYKASTSTANTNAAELAVAISNAISAAQGVLSTSAAFKTALGTTDDAKIQAAAKQAAVNLVVKTVVPSIIDKSTGTLNASVTSSTVIESTQATAASSSTTLAIGSNAPKALPGTIQAFVEGLIVGNSSNSGDYIDASGTRVNGKWSGYRNALEITYLKGDIATTTGTEKNMVLVGSNWFKRYQDGTNYYLTTKGWIIEDVNAPGEPAGECMSIKQTASGPNQLICLTKFDYSGKKVSDLISDPCKDSSGSTIAGCDVNTVFPATTYAYKLNMTFDQEAYKLWVSTTWNGFGDGLNPKQTTLDGWAKFVKDNKINNTTGNGCTTAYTITAYDAAAQTGTIAFADMSKYKDCDEVWKNMGTVKYTETQKFVFKKVNGETVMTYQSPLIYAKNNPSDSSSYAQRMFGTYNGKIFDGEYWPTNTKYVIGLDGYTKIGNKNLLDTYLKMVGAPAFPY